MTAKRYLGDGVYVELDELGAVLTTETGVEVTNRIVLEPDVLAALFLWVSDLQRRAALIEASRN